MIRGLAPNQAVTEDEGEGATGKTSWSCMCFGEQVYMSRIAFKFPPCRALAYHLNSLYTRHGMSGARILKEKPIYL